MQDNNTDYTRFERARIISARALQLAFGAPPLIKVKKGMTCYEVAKEEFEKGVLPLTVKRSYDKKAFSFLRIASIKKMQQNQ